MKPSTDVRNANKIYNCIDELLMEDADQANDKWKQQIRQNPLNATDGFRKVNLKKSKAALETSPTSKKKRVQSTKKDSSPNKKKPSEDRANHQKPQPLHFMHPRKQTHFPKPLPSIKSTLTIIDKKQPQSFTWDPNIIREDSLRLKKTGSYELGDPNLDKREINKIEQYGKEGEKDLIRESHENHDSFTGSREISPASLLSPSARSNSNSLTDPIKYNEIRINTNEVTRNTQWRRSLPKKQSLFRASSSRHSPSPSQSIPHPLSSSLTQPPSTRPPTVKFTPSPEPPLPSQQQQNPPATEFHLSHEQLQFLSLLYPNEPPEQLMIKLLKYYEQQVQYKNSFQEIVYRDEKSQKNYFFKSKGNLSKADGQKKGEKRQGRRGVDGDAEQWNRNTIDQYDGFVHEHQGINGDFAKLIPSEKMNTSTEADLNEYTKLKEECLAALGSQMIQTQIKNSLVQTANVNYYTRQYAMPHIMQFIEQKNLVSQQNLQKVSLKHHTKQQLLLQHPPSTPFLLLPTPSTYTHIPDQYLHKVYIPANSRGQCFDMDYEPSGELYDYVSENDYRRILRDVNHLIQKVLVYHRHNSFLKKKNNSLFTGWNLVLVVTLMTILALFYAETVTLMEEHSSYIEIMVYFCLSFMLILIMGNAFNNYKKSIKRPSLIKDICEEITNYLDFVNCSSKGVKWVLGKDFFWLEVWVYVGRAGGRVAEG